ncbi:MAG: tetratricopeptide repeat protein [Paludibacteraceae bacterium]|nr:tetratricopeptide repeat protein [Paludibacteraceae bacterium]
MKRIFLIVNSLLLACSLFAVTQEGTVRTIARKNHPGMPVDGAVIRIRGSHNAVQSQTQGSFSLLLYNLENGDPYAISSVVKSGYELAEQELIGKKLPCSDKVPLEILLVSRAQLQQDKEQIEAKARENVELYYQARLAELEQQLAAKELNEQEFNRRLAELEGQYERFEPLLQTMSDRLARTDYERLDSLTALIQTAIESGNPEEAERLVREKGDMEAREAAIREQETQIRRAQQTIDEAQAQLDQLSALTAQQKRELAEDYFRLYSSFLSRFQNDSANFYIQKRAALDTLNVDYQLQAGQFVMDIMADRELAKTYFERAYRIAGTQYGEESGQMATACFQLGAIYKLQKEYDKAFEWCQRSLAIREKLRGKNSIAASEALNILGELYLIKKDYKNALTCHERSLKIRQKELGKYSLPVATSLNNIGVVYYKQNQLDKAEKMFLEVRAIYEQRTDVPLNLIAGIHNNLGGLAFKQGRYEEALGYFNHALELYTRVKGENHPLTRNTQKYITACKQKIETK